MSLVRGRLLHRYYNLYRDDHIGWTPSLAILGWLQVTGMYLDAAKYFVIWYYNFKATTRIKEYSRQSFGFQVLGISCSGNQK